MGFTTCFDRQAGEVSKFSAYGMFSDFLFQTTTYAVRGEAYGSSKMTTYNVRGEASKGLSKQSLTERKYWQKYALKLGCCRTKVKVDCRVSQSSFKTKMTC